MKYFSQVFLSLILLSVGTLGGTQQKTVTSLIPVKTKVTNNTQSTAKLRTIAGLSWYTDIDSALYVAQKEQKNVIVMVGEDTCKWCRKMRQRTLTDVRIQKKLQSYILVYLKRSSENIVNNIPDFDGNIPSFFFMKDNRELIESVVGYFTADDFLQYIDEIEE